MSIIENRFPKIDVKKGICISMRYQRKLKKVIKKNFFKGKVIIIAGARRVGKTTLALDILKEYSDKKVVRFNCDNPDERLLLNDKNIETLNNLVGDAEIVFIDEGQKVLTIGQTLKLLVDQHANKKQIIVTGSSSFNLLDGTEEALTGRKFVYHLYPLSFAEIFSSSNYLQIKKELDNLMIFGNYPEVVNAKTFNAKAENLKNLSSSYLYKDILEFQQVKSSDFLRLLLKALALQIGSEVSYTEISRILSVDKKTVERYVNLLEKNYIIFRLPPYFSNPRKEISKLRKIYFYDLGIRNAIINNFNSLDSRDDGGRLWENLAVVERLKYQTYKQIYSNNYFWRSYNLAEVDWVEEREGKVYGFEIKWKKKKITPPKSWKGDEYKVITPENLEDFIV